MPAQPLRVTQSADDISRHYTQEDFATVLRVSADLGISTGSDIAPAISQALSNNGDGTLIVFDADGHYPVSQDIAAPSGVTEWGLLSPNTVTTTLHTDHTIPATTVTKGLFGGYIIERESASVTTPAVALHVSRPGPALTADPTPGAADLLGIYVTGTGEDRAIELSSEDVSELYAAGVACTDSTPGQSRAAIDIPERHTGTVKLDGCEVTDFQIGVNAPDALGDICVKRGYYDAIHGVRLAGHGTSVRNTVFDARQPGSAAIVWDAGTVGNDGGEITGCEITVDGGRAAIAAADVAGRCTIANCDIQYDTAADSGNTTGAVIDAPSPTPSKQNAMSVELAGSAGWEIHNTTITGDGDPDAVIWLTDRPASGTRNMTIHMDNTDGIVYDGDTDGIVENSIINVWGTTVNGSMLVRNVDEVATPGGLSS